MNRLVVAVVLVDRLAAPRCVLAARRQGVRLANGWWELPGGKVEPGEDPVHAIRREVREELGVGVRLGPQLPGPLVGDWPVASGPAVTWPVPPDVRIRVWWAEVAGGRPYPREGNDELRWLSAQSLESVRWLPGNLAMLAKVAPFLHG